ncbi:hypothetical protein B7463_g10910, partial [Scytalidium lignicola]
MASDSESPLLGNSNDRPSSKRSQRSNLTHESTPLLSRTEDDPRYDIEDITRHSEDDERVSSPAEEFLRSLETNGGQISKPTKSRRRWPTIVAILLLGSIAIGIIIAAFFIPAAVEEYAKEALVVEPTNLSIDSFTSTGVSVRVQASFRLDASRVRNKHVRNIGRFGTWIAKKVESEKAKVEVYLPEYGNVLIGTAVVPPLVVSIQNDHTTYLNFLTDVEPGDVEGIRQVANDWLEGRLAQLRIQGKTDVGLKSGWLPLGIQSVSESFVFEGDDVPAIPEYNITRLNFREVPISPSGHQGMAVDVSLSLINTYPVKFTIPPLGFDILVPNCGSDQPYIRVADATTGSIEVEPRSEVMVDVGGVVREIPKTLLKTCPGSKTSPLDLLLGDYIHGRDTTIFVRGSNAPSSSTPEWITKLISSVTVPVPFPGHTFDGLIKGFSVTDAHFSLPDPFAEPGSDDSKPQISGNIVVIAGIPKEMNFNLNVTRVKAKSNVLYKSKKFGELNLKKWQAAKSERNESNSNEEADLKITSIIRDAPLDITDDDVFTDVLQAMLFGSSRVELKIEALVDAEVSTVLGELIIRDMPAEGIVPVQPISPGGDFTKLNPQVGKVKILDTSESAIHLQASVNFTNPTEYTATVPYVNIHILNNGSIIGSATAENVSVISGNNSNIMVEATWDPFTYGGKTAKAIGRELLSQYVSGFNTTLTFQTHEGSIPHQPRLGKALSKFAIEIPTPRVSTPSTGKDGDSDGEENEKPHFLTGAIFHFLSSTAQFELYSPLQYSSIYLEEVNATALYNHTEPVGWIDYNLPFEVPPGRSLTPKLPVDWSMEGVGYDAVKKALGGTLKLDARGNITVRLGRWSETVWYMGDGIGAEIRF